MIQPIAPPRRPAGHPPLAQAQLLTSALRVLDEARRLEASALGLSTHPDTLVVVERLVGHREILARRAANVALASVVSAEELRDLRAAATELVAVTGWVSRRLHLTRLS